MESSQNPSPEGLRRAKLEWEQSTADLREAKRESKAGAVLESCFHSLQAAVNVLSAVCRLNGHFRFPAHSPVQMLALCREADARLDSLEQECNLLEGVQDVNPFGDAAAQVTPEECKQALQAATTIHKVVRSYLKDNKNRLFAP